MLSHILNSGPDLRGGWPGIPPRGFRRVWRRFINSSGDTWRCPDFVDRVWVRAVGGGASGGKSATATIGGGGGGGGGWCIGELMAVAGTDYLVQTGVGGGVTSFAFGGAIDGANGTPTVISGRATYILLPGGNAGLLNGTGGAASGLAVTSVHGLTFGAGGAGGNGVNAAAGNTAATVDSVLGGIGGGGAGGGGGGGSTPFGRGGTGGATSNGGPPADGRSGAGSGGVAYDVSNTYINVAGADGFVEFTWDEPWYR